jgi:hypothetical protein
MTWILDVEDDAKVVVYKTINFGMYLSVRGAHHRCIGS